jgi:predicted Ser/Thr protein kinase
MTYHDAVNGFERDISKGKFAQADIFIARFQGQQFIVKDFGSRGTWLRKCYGRAAIDRESRAYEALAGIEGLPARTKRLTPHCLAVEYLEGKDLGGASRQEIGPGVIRQFEQIINELHGRGWVHLDLHRRKNILLVNGKVFVIDLASSLHPGRIPLVGRFLVRLIGLADLLSIIKLKTLFAPELLSSWERRAARFRNLFFRTKWDA